MCLSLVVLNSSRNDAYNQHIITSLLALAARKGSTSTKPDLEGLAGPSSGGWRSRVTATPTPNQRDTKKTRLRFRMLGIALFWHTVGGCYEFPNDGGKCERMKRFEAEWFSYRREVLPRNASVGQVEECRRAFYGGAAAIHSVLMQMLTPGPKVTDEDHRRMQELFDELVEFGESVKPRGAERKV